MQIESQDFLDLVEKSNEICFVDIEATGLKGDYNTVLVVSVLPYSGKPTTLSVKKPARDKELVKEVKDILEHYLCWVTYYGKGFDIPMLNTRLLRWGCEPIDKRHHIDMYYTLKQNLLTGRRSQAHMLGFFECEEEKMSLSPNEWPKAIETADLKVMKARCESDVAGLRALYQRTRGLIRDISR